MRQRQPLPELASAIGYANTHAATTLQLAAASTR